MGHQERACLGRKLEEVNLRCQGINGDIFIKYEVCCKCQMKDVERCLLILFVCCVISIFVPILSLSLEK